MTKCKSVCRGKSAICTWQTSTFVGVVAGLAAGAPVEALGGGAGQGGHLAGAPAVPRDALAAEGAVRVHAQASVEAQAGLAALVDVAATVPALEPGRAGAVVLAIPVGTAGTVGTGAGGTRVDEGAVLTWGRWERGNGSLNGHIKHTHLTIDIVSFERRHPLGALDSSVPRNPRWHTQVNCGMPLATWLLQAAPLRHGDRRQGSRC